MQLPCKYIKRMVVYNLLKYIVYTCMVSRNIDLYWPFFKFFMKICRIVIDKVIILNCRSISKSDRNDLVTFVFKIEIFFNKWMYLLYESFLVIILKKNIRNELIVPFIVRLIGPISSHLNKCYSHVFFVDFSIRVPLRWLKFS